MENDKWLKIDGQETRLKKKCRSPQDQAERCVFSWRPSDMGRYKVNCDASFDMEGNMVGIGLIIRDSEGTVMASSSQSIENSRIQRYEPIEQILFKFPFIQSGVLYWLGFCGACYPMESETQRTKPVAAFMAFGTNGHCCSLCLRPETVPCGSALVVMIIKDAVVTDLPLDRETGIDAAVVVNWINEGNRFTPPSTSAGCRFIIPFASAVAVAAWIVNLYRKIWTWMLIIIKFWDCPLVWKGLN
ncbi:hypothetical protein Q3G72_032938 [Acer saccharum]|nr:hypothetical protein Q3G72_032938 [Acer saccharum]